jgi:hypothetical protein
VFDDVLNVPHKTISFQIPTFVAGSFSESRHSDCDQFMEALYQSFWLAMASHAGPILINFGVAPIVLRISNG